MKYAKIVDGRVDVVRFTPKGGFISCPDGVFGGFLYDGGAFTAPETSAPTEDEKNAKAANIAEQIENASLAASLAEVVFEMKAADDPKLSRDDFKTLLAGKAKDKQVTK